MHYCFKTVLSDKGWFVCIAHCPDLMYWILLKQRKHWHGEEVASEIFEPPEKLIQIANENEWKHELYTQEYLIDVTEVFDSKSTKRNLLLDFMTHSMNFRETADKQLVDETMALIKDLSHIKDGKGSERKRNLCLSSTNSNYVSILLNIVSALTK